MTWIKALQHKMGISIFTPDNHLTPILRWGRYNRLTEPGYSTFNPYCEEALSPIGTGVRVGLFSVKQVLSKDNIAHDINLTVLFNYLSLEPRCVTNSFNN